MKRVLFIHIDFYDYNKRIIKEIAELGFVVDTFCEDIPISMTDKILKTINVNKDLDKNEKHQKSFLEKLSKNKLQYDFIFVIKGEKLSRLFLMELKKMNPTAKFILYLWDDVARISNFNNNKNCYDVVYSFDKLDCKKYKLNFLPLFFCEDYIFEKSYVDKEIDIFFSGWLHSDRMHIIESILPSLKENNMNYFIYLFTGRLNVLKNNIRNMNYFNTPKFIKYKKMSLEKNAEYTLKSKVILDVQHYSQNGLTMRVFESLSSKCKLVTTNDDIKSYDFYNKNNILVIDRKNPIIDRAFIESPYVEVPDEIINKYSLKNWVKTILIKGN